MKMKKLKVKKPVAVSLSLVLGMVILIFITMLLFNVSDYGITIASFGATIFMVLSKKKISHRIVFGSYMIATVFGFLFSNISEMASLNVALAAIGSIIVMTLLELQHAPAIGMSIAIVLNKFNIWTDLMILFSIFLIFGLTLYLKISLTDPVKALRFIELDEERIKWRFRQKEIPQYLKMGSNEDS
jgi:hypothetical protein